MYAIVEVAGMQFKVKKNDEILAPKLKAEEGSTLEFDRVLFTSDDKTVNVGNPVVKGAKVKAVVVGEERGKKGVVFKKKRRKGYKVKKGHRQEYTRLKIEDIILS
jgi:large subunit ribosomal protein L21